MEVKTSVVGQNGDPWMAVDDDEPVSPTGQYFNSSVLSLAVLGVFETDVPIDDSQAISTLKSLFLPISPRFSSVMVRDNHGVKHWRRVKVNLEDHIKVPIFPGGAECYDGYAQDYISKISMDQFPENRPLWDIHLIKYPTQGGSGTLVFRLHHALGDGFSLMGALFSCIRRADNPELPLTFPSSRAKLLEKEVGWWSKIVRVPPRALAMCVNTVRDFGWSILKSKLLEDDRTPVRSGVAGVEFRPITISTVDFTLDDIQQVKAKIGGTVNDVITGTIFYGIQLYIQAAGHGAKSAAAVTALVLLNTRAVGNYQSLQEMSKPNSESSWGNQFGFLHISLPLSTDAEAVDPLQFVLRARETIKAKRSSLAVYLTGQLLETVRKIKGPEASAQYIHQALSNTSMTISSLIGPLEQMIIVGHPIRSLYFMVVRVPQSLTITIMSYMGKMKVAIGTEKDFIDSELLVCCMEKSFQRIFGAAVGKKA